MTSGRRFGSGVTGALRELVTLNPGPDRTVIAVQAGVGMALPVLVLSLAGQPTWGLVASSGAFLAIHFGALSVRERAARLPVIALALLGAAALAVAAAGVPILGPVTLGLVSIVAAVLLFGLKIGPPGMIFFLLVPGGAALAAAPSELGGLGLPELLVLALVAGGLVVSYLVAVAPLALPRFRARPEERRSTSPVRFSLRGESGVIVVRVAVAVTIAVALTAASGLHATVWTTLAAAAILQSGVRRRMTAMRAVHRVVGTAVGIVLYLGMAVFVPSGWVLALVLGMLQFGVEWIVVRHYGLALVLITPLALLIAGGGHTGDFGAIAADRLLDTAIGAAIAVLILAVSLLRERALRNARD